MAANGGRQEPLFVNFACDPDVIFRLQERCPKAVERWLADIEDPRTRRVASACLMHGVTRQEIARREGLSPRRVSEILRQQLEGLSRTCELYSGVPPWHVALWACREQSRSVYHKPHDVWKRQRCRAHEVRRRPPQYGERFLLFRNVPPDF